MQILTKIYITNDEGEKALGYGPIRLLMLIEELGSLKKASESMGMAYTKASRLIKTAESSLGFSLIEKKTGGKGGGGSALTEKAQLLIEGYNSLCKTVKSFAENRFSDFEASLHNNDPLK